MNEVEILTYVKAAALANRLFLAPERADAVAQHFSRTALIAKLLDSAPLIPEQELAEIYRPAPFPVEEI
jgi:hypothetical protein